MAQKHRPGIKESRIKRSQHSLERVLNMREAYVKIVQERLADPAIKDTKKMSLGAIAKRLTDQNYKAPRDGKITYKIVRRLSEIVGVVEPLDIPPQVKKSRQELEVGDYVEVIARRRARYGDTGVIRGIAPDRSGFSVEFSGRSKLATFFAEEVQHQPDESYYLNHFAFAEQPM